MTGFIVNARKSLRLPLRCTAWCEGGGRAGQGHTEDLGPRGCRLVLGEPLAPGERVRLMLWHDLGGSMLGVQATVVWVSPAEPWRHGLAFAPPDRAAAERWFETVLEGHPELLLDDPVPDQVPLSSRIHPTGLPAAALGVEESTVLRLAAGRPSVAELQERLGADWTRAQRALFSLLARGTVTLGEEGDPAPAQSIRSPGRLPRA